MTKRLITSLLLLAALCLPTVVMAQEEPAEETAPAVPDAYGTLDTVYAEVTKLDNLNWAIKVSYAGDANIIGLSLPFKFSSGINRIVADSVHYSPTVADFAYKTMRADTAIQCVTVGLIANIGPGPKQMLKPGTEPVVTIYISSIEDKPLDQLTIDTTTTYPNNTLMAAADMLQGTPPDTIRLTHLEQRILPAFVLTKPKQ
jgi:hypothetical protein